jgi:hypothetical protein
MCSCIGPEQYVQVLDQVEHITFGNKHMIPITEGMLVYQLLQIMCRRQY